MSSPTPTVFPQRIYFITDMRLSGLSHSQQVREMIAGGAGLIQLRDKQSSSQDFYDQAALCVQIARESGTSIIINDRVDIAVAVGADGVHLGQDDLPPAAARKLLGPNAIIGLSTHNVDQAAAAVEQPVDYIAIGPVFETSSKLNPDPVIGLEGIQQVRSAIGAIPLVAIGGIKKQDLSSVIAAGADSAAVISATLVPPSDIATNTRSLLHTV